MVCDRVSVASHDRCLFERPEYVWPRSADCATCESDNLTCLSVHCRHRLDVELGSACNGLNVFRECIAVGKCLSVDIR